MSDFNIRADAVDVEQIMRQIRARIRDKRGVDYTEEQIQELARVRLEKFLDPKGVRSDLLEQFRRRAETDLPPNYEFDDTTLFASSKPIVAFFRRLLRPVLKLFLNPAITALQHAVANQPAPARPRRALLRDRSQPGGRDDAHQHRCEDHPDAGRVDVGTARLQRASRPGARGGRAVSARCPVRARARRGGAECGRLGEGLHHPASIRSPAARACGRVAAAAARAAQRAGLRGEPRGRTKDEGRGTPGQRRATSDE